jgi:hypothetical protein
LILSELEYQQIKERNDERIHSVFFTSRFNHLNYHNSFRPGEVHLLIAEKGSGKSTLVRAWITEILAQGKKCYLRLSEESDTPYRDELASFFGSKTLGLLSNLAVDSELSLTPKETQYYYQESLIAKIRAFDANIFILDNFTTSLLGSKSPKEQEQWARNFKQMAIALNIPVVIVAHTRKGYKNLQLATGDDIRGNSTLSNMASYIYTLTVRPDLPEHPSILFCDKSRHHTLANKKKFLMQFDPELRTFKGDKLLDKETLKQILGVK